MKTIIKAILEKIIPEEHLWKFEIFKNWPNIIGTMAKHVTIEKIDQSILYLNVSHSTWAHELHLLSPLLQKKINTLFKEPKITSIRFYISKKTQQVLVPQSQSKSTSTLYHNPIQLTPQEFSILAPCPCPELQLNIAAYLMRCKTHQRRKE